MEKLPRVLLNQQIKNIANLFNLNPQKAFTLSRKITDESANYFAIPNLDCFTDYQTALKSVFAHMKTLAPGFFDYAKGYRPNDIGRQFFFLKWVQYAQKSDIWLLPIDFAYQGLSPNNVILGLKRNEIPLGVYETGVVLLNYYLSGVKPNDAWLQCVSEVMRRGNSEERIPYFFSGETSCFATVGMNDQVSRACSVITKFELNW